MNALEHIYIFLPYYNIFKYHTFKTYKNVILNITISQSLCLAATIESIACDIIANVLNRTKIVFANICVPQSIETFDN